MTDSQRVFVGKASGKRGGQAGLSSRANKDSQGSRSTGQRRAPGSEAGKTVEALHEQTRQTVEVTNLFLNAQPSPTGLVDFQYRPSLHQSMPVKSGWFDTTCQKPSGFLHVQTKVVELIDTQLSEQQPEPSRQRFGWNEQYSHLFLHGNFWSASTMVWCLSVTSLF
jgi:hypothetical protein